MNQQKIDFSLEKMSQAQFGKSPTPTNTRKDTSFSTPSRLHKILWSVAGSVDICFIPFMNKMALLPKLLSSKPLPHATLTIPFL